MNKSTIISKLIDELLSDLGKIPEPVFGFVHAKSDLSTRLKAVRKRRAKSRKKK